MEKLRAGLSGAHRAGTVLVGEPLTTRDFIRCTAALPRLSEMSAHPFMGLPQCEQNPPWPRLYLPQWEHRLAGGFCTGTLELPAVLDETDQISAATQPRNVHPRNRFRSKMEFCWAWFLRLAIIAGKKYNASPSARHRRTKSTPSISMWATLLCWSHSAVRVARVFHWQSLHVNTEYTKTVGLPCAPVQR